MLNFSKYVAAGNDFVVIDNWDQTIELDHHQILALCHRRFGVGADGILLLGPDKGTDFRMHYYNADGSRGEMCGNGARSLVHFAQCAGKAGTQGSFRADDGVHLYSLADDRIQIQILVTDHLHEWPLPGPECGFINTGVPHLLVPVQGLENFDLDPLGRSMNADPLHPQGTNVNVLELESDQLRVRTWERGVNQETLACGTGATAAGIYAHQRWGLTWPITLKFPGGDLTVDHRANEYWLGGPVELVFAGRIELSTFHRN